MDSKNGNRDHGRIVKPASKRRTNGGIFHLNMPECSFSGLPAAVQNGLETSQTAMFNAPCCSEFFQQWSVVFVDALDHVPAAFASDIRAAELRRTVL